jgi:hypothetical protein
MNYQAASVSSLEQASQSGQRSTNLLKRRHLCPCLCACALVCLYVCAVSFILSAGAVRFILSAGVVCLLACSCQQVINVK